MSLQIGVAGAGIGGLAAAAFLARDANRVTIYDQFDAPRPVGSGLVIQPVGQQALAACGTWNTARTLGAPITAMYGHEVGHGRAVLNVRYDRRGDGAFGLSIHRASLFHALYDRVLALGVTVETGRRVTAAQHGRFRFEGGGNSPRHDLLIDASGAGSPLSPLVSRPLPYGAIWGVVDWPAGTDLPADELRQAYRRASRMIGVMPMGRLPGGTGNKAAIFWSLPRDGHETWRAAGLAAWKGEACALWPALEPFIAQITDPDQMTMARYTHGTLKRPFADGIAFIGDAAHRASPQLGQGANMALLDAWALSRAIATRSGGIPGALATYARARRRHVRLYQLTSAAFTPQYQSDSRVLPVLRDRLLYPASQIPPIPALLTRLVRGDFLHPMPGLDPA